MVDNSKQNATSLDDVMSAMDVVDVLRHQQDLVARELDSESREQQLLERLKKIYKGQGMDVPDHILKEGIKALEEDRFKYTTREKNFSSTLANLYVRRNKWGKPLMSLLVIFCVFWSGYYLTQIRPEQQIRAAIPKNVMNTFNEIKTVAKDRNIVARAYDIRQSAEAAFKNKKFTVAQSLHNELDSLLTVLRQSFDIRIISRPNESSGIWRVAEINSASRNYYLLVEAVNSQGKVLEIPILNEEDGKRKIVSKWGLRVNRNIFNRVANDKRDDGIIQKNLVGKKKRGFLEPEYLINTNGSAITDW